MAIKKVKNKKQIFENLKEREVHYLTFKELEGKYYLAGSSYKLANNKTPLGSLIAEINESWSKVYNDDLASDTLPKKLPEYIIDGFKKRLKNDIKKSLYLEYKAYQHNECNYFELEDDTLEITTSFKEAKQPLFDIVNSLTNIEDFFRFAMLLQNDGAMRIYLLDLFASK